MPGKNCLGDGFFVEMKDATRYAKMHLLFWVLYIYATLLLLSMTHDDTIESWIERRMVKLLLSWIGWLSKKEAEIRFS